MKVSNPRPSALRAEECWSRKRLLRIQVGQTVLPKETELLRADGTTLPAELVGFRLDFDGELAIVTLVRDITRERDLQKRLLVADRMVSIGTLAAGVAHELKWRPTRGRPRA
ncbi:MAG TPA: hypothetical protein VEM76_01565 [Anaeromyxobacteraceae bacterium]|nr:hypothetical protein [Anaeromyxobacteraceae bacterium]